MRHGGTRRPAHGLPGLFVVLIAVAGLALTYGLGHPRPIRLCTAHDHGAAAVLQAVPPAVAQPLDPSGADSVDLALSLAVLLALLALGLAARPRPAGARSPRSGWGVRPPVVRPPPAPSLASLQVLRL